jgi:general stress protein 26
MIDERLQELLSQPEIVRITTVRPDGYPHSVPIWFMYDTGDLVMFTSRISRKVRNVQSNNKGCLAIGGDPVDSPAYAIDGDIFIEEDPEKALTARITRHYESPEKAAEWLATWENEDFVILRLRPQRVMKVS